MNPEEEGYAAARAGLSFATCPYREQRQSAEWMRGYQRGEREEGEQLGHFRDTVCKHHWLALRSIPPSWRCADCSDITEERPR